MSFTPPKLHSLFDTPGIKVIMQVSIRIEDKAEHFMR